jgi:hypothetical protein
LDTLLAARFLKERGQPVVKEITSILKQANMTDNINLQRQIAIIHAYTGTTGLLSQWCDMVIEKDDYRRYEAALLITYLCGPRNDHHFPKAVVKGSKKDVEYVLSWAEKHKTTVLSRFCDYLERCLDTTYRIYSRVPDLGKMVASWAIAISSELNIGDMYLERIKVAIKQLLDKCPAPELRDTVENTLKILRYFE